MLASDTFRTRQHDLLGLMYLARGAFLRRHAAPPPTPWAPPGRSGLAQHAVHPAPLPGHPRLTSR